jgi:ABC-type nitrate/sulfonate/bicarbonate transport system substrate-binding protein
LSLVACGSGQKQATSEPGSPNADPVTIRVGGSAGAMFALQKAMDDHLFDGTGITVTTQAIQGGPKTVAALASGSVDVGYADMLAWAGALGNGFKSVQLLLPANGPALNGGTGILVNKSSGITSAAGLAGKKLGLFGIPQISTAADLWLDHEGVDRSKVQFVTIPTQEAFAPSLAKGDVDAIFTNSPTTELIQNSADVVDLGSPYDLIPADASIAGYFVNKGFADAHQQALAVFAAKVREGAQRFLDATPEERARVSADHGGLDLSSLQAKIPDIVKSYKWSVVEPGAINVGATESFIQTAVKYKTLEKDVDIKPFLHPLATTGSRG